MRFLKGAGNDDDDDDDNPPPAGMGCCRWEDFLLFRGTLVQPVASAIGGAPFFSLIFAHLLIILSSRFGEVTGSGVGRNYGC